MKGIGLYRAWVIALLLPGMQALAGIADTKHNLSVSGPGDVKVVGATEICIFCHTRYNPNPQAPAWNRYASGITYVPYTSSTLNSYPGQPSGASLLCLSCHDGTTAMGDLVGEAWELSLQLAMREISGRPSNVGTDLSDDHPISFLYNDSYSADPAAYVHPGALTSEVRLDASGQMQCTSCHDPHDDTLGDFLLRPVEEGELCLTCHLVEGWPESAHTAITHLFPVADGLGELAYHTRTACTLCHTSHAAGSVRLLYFENEESACLVCHNMEIVGSNLEAEFSKPYRHPVERTSGVHDPVESPIIDSRHVECVDCHNPHAMRASLDGDPALAAVDGDSAERDLRRGPLAAVAGVSAGGAAIEAVPGIGREYELCLRCHGDSNNQPAPPITREDNETNLRVELNPTNPSYHPVFATGVNLDVPSLIEPFTTNSVITCGDCHGNNDPLGPRGPHGSIFPSLLEREYRTQFPSVESASSYALCYKCHDRNSVLGDESFSSHNLHVTGAGAATPDLATPCSVCHDPHGSQQASLINFDISVVERNGEGRLEFFTAGGGSGGCYLACHGVDHNPLCYSPGGGPVPGC